MSHLQAAMTSSAIVADAYNPFTGIAPSLGPFADVVGTKIGVFIALAWAIGFCYAAYHLIAGIARASRAKSTGYADVLDDARRELMFSAGSLAGLAAIPVIFGVLVA